MQRSKEKKDKKCRKHKLQRKIRGKGNKKRKVTVKYSSKNEYMRVREFFLHTSDTLQFCSLTYRQNAQVQYCVGSLPLDATVSVRDNATSQARFRHLSDICWWKLVAHSRNLEKHSSHTILLSSIPPL